MRGLVIGLGNPDRGDDAIGPLVARAVGEGVQGRAETIFAGGDPAELIELWAGRPFAIVVDACASGAPPGTLRRFDVASGPIPELSGAVSSHGFGLGAAIELARAMEMLPERMIIYAVEGASFEPGTEPGMEVAKKGRELAARILDEISHWARQGEGVFHA